MAQFVTAEEAAAHAVSAHVGSGFVTRRARKCRLRKVARKGWKNTLKGTKR